MLLSPLEWALIIGGILLVLLIVVLGFLLVAGDEPDDPVEYRDVDLSNYRRIP